VRPVTLGLARTRLAAREKPDGTCPTVGQASLFRETAEPILKKQTKTGGKKKKNYLSITGDLTIHHQKKPFVRDL
jgi:hypothetical protein